MAYPEAIAALNALGAELAGTRHKFELEHMRTLMRALHDPHNSFPSVLIAGTNGKGSTAATLASICASSGYRTGLYTSPHLLRVNERIQIGAGGSAGNDLFDIDDDTFAQCFTEVQRAAALLVGDGSLPQSPSFFETVTAMAFLAFAKARVEIAVLEVGLGGRLDATNIVEPLASVITDVALDHTEWLGETITEIAREKAGILRQNGVLVTLPQHPEANSSIGERAVALNVTGINAAAYLPQPSPRDYASGAYAVPAFGTTLEVEPQLAGDHQRRNLALAIATAEYLHGHAGFPKITAATTAAGVRNVRWPARLERGMLPSGAALLLDVAHNPAGVWTLRSHLSRSFASSAEDALPGPRTLVFSALNDKAIDEMAQVLFPLFDEPGDRVLLVPVNSPRATPVERLQALAATHGEGATGTVQVLRDVAEAYRTAVAQAGGSVVVAGSVYLVGEWKQAAKARHKEQH